MRARSIALRYAAFSTVAVFATFTAALSLAFHAQQPGNPAGASSSLAIPAEAQARLDKLQAELKAAQDKGDAAAEARALNARGDLYFSISAYQQALDDYNHALELSNAAGDLRDQVTALNGIGSANRNTGQLKKALEFHRRALSLARALKDAHLEATILRGIGSELNNQGETREALDSFNQAIALFRQVNDTDGEARTMINAGFAYSSVGEQQKALDDYNQALRIFRELGNGLGEAVALSSIGEVCRETGQEEKALNYYGQALPVFRRLGNRDGEAKALRTTGDVYRELGQMQKALDFYHQALSIFRQVDNKLDEGHTLTTIGMVYDVWGDPRKALDFYNQALLICREMGDQAGEAKTLNNIGVVYDELGQPQKALEVYNQVLPIYRQTGDRVGEAGTLSNLGVVYGEMGQNQKALEFYNQALPVEHEVDDPDGEAETLNGIGNIYQAMSERQKALEYYNRALPLFRQVGDRDNEAQTLDDLGEAYRGLGNRQRALVFCEQALPLARVLNDLLLEAEIFHELFLSEKGPKPALAVFYGKQAVNHVQQVRGNLQGLDKELQKSFVSFKSDYFHELADLLIDRGRLPEAQQVLDLLKQQEYSDYVRGEKVNPASPLSLTSAEQQAEQDYQKTTAQLVSLGEQWSQMKKIPSRTPEQEKQFEQLDAAITSASKGLNDYYSRLYMLFGQNSAANKQVADVKGDTAALKQTIAKMPHTVALYTLVAKDRYIVIVITPAATVAREYPIAERDLNRKVAAFERVLRDRSKDPKPLAQELYKILIGPVKADLDQAQAKMLIWSLDGVLRYIPVAALYDGKQYVVENYNTATMTPASITHLAEEPDVSNLNVVAMGISRQYEEALPALPAVTGELDEIVKDAQVEGANGVLPGTILLNDGFTEKAMESHLNGQHAVVHIASHFVFEPGDDTRSYLLLAGKDESGTGFHLTVADFRDNQNLALDDTDLLTLSACETGMSGDAGDGHEVDGLGTTAQLKGARAVISSLWEVDDASTGALMADFYKRWADGAGKVMKVEALRQAQLDLLLGKARPQNDGSGRGVAVATSQETTSSGSAHPYYWAPFVLMGNWK